MPTIPVPQDQITRIHIGHTSWSLFCFLPPFLLSLIKNKTFAFHAWNLTLFHNSGNTCEKRIWTSLSSILCMDTQGGPSLEDPVTAAGWPECLYCPCILTRHESGKVLECTERAPTLCRGTVNEIVLCPWASGPK